MIFDFLSYKMICSKSQSSYFLLNLNVSISTYIILAERLKRWFQWTLSNKIKSGNHLQRPYLQLLWEIKGQHKMLNYFQKLLINFISEQSQKLSPLYYNLKEIQILFSTNPNYSPKLTRPLVFVNGIKSPSNYWQNDSSPVPQGIVIVLHHSPHHKKPTNYL